MADQLCTTAQVKSRLGITDATDDTLLSELIDQVTAWIEGFTGRKLVPETAATYVFDTEAGYVLRIPRGIRAITSMGVATTVHQPDTGGTYTTVTAPDRILRPKAVDLPEGWPATEVRISRGSLVGTVTAFGRIDNGCTITGDFGFAATPADVQSVAMDAVAAAYSQRRNPSQALAGADGMALPPWVAFFSKGSPQRQTLERYRFAAIG